MNNEEKFRKQNLAEISKYITTQCYQHVYWQKKQNTAEISHGYQTYFDKIQQIQRCATSILLKKPHAEQNCFFPVKSICTFKSINQ